MRTTSTGTTDGNISTYTRAPEQGSDLINNFDFVLVFKNDEPTSGSFVQSKYAKDCCYAMINSGWTVTGSPFKSIFNNFRI